MRAENNEFPYVTIAEQAAAPADAVVATQRLFIDEADHLLYLVDEDGNVSAVQQPPSLADPTTTRGDLIVRGAATIGRLALGTVGKVPMSDGTDPVYAYPTGVRWTAATSMPGTPATGQRVTRTDLNRDFFYDGTRWLSVELFHDPLSGILGTSAASFSANFSMGRWTPFHTTFDIWLEDLWLTTLVSTTNDGSKFWTLDLRKYQSNYSTSSSVVSRATSGDTAGTAVTSKNAIAALLTPGTYVILQIDATKTSTPGALSYPAAAVSYRLVGV